MTADLRALYGETLLDHSRSPRNRRTIEGSLRAERHNPMCGDRVTVYARLDADAIAEVGFDESACAIVVAAASLMTERVQGQTVHQVLDLSDRIRTLLTQPGFGPLDELGPLAALGGVRQFPIRIRCALLPWDALLAALASQHGKLQSTSRRRT